MGLGEPLGPARGRELRARKAAIRRKSRADCVANHGNLRDLRELSSPELKEGGEILAEIRSGGLRLSMGV